MKNNDITKTVMAAAMAVVFVGMACWVGEADYNHTKIGEMSDSTYDTVLRELADAGNSSPSEAEIVKWWENHHR